MPKATRLYLRTAQSEYRRFVWFQNNKLNEMLLGVYGLSGTRPILRLWPEREETDKGLAAMTFSYTDAVSVGEIDHITCHADGTFHIKTAKGENVYLQRMRRVEPLGPDAGIFLDFVLHSDFVQHYPVAHNRPKLPHVWFDMPADSYIRFRGMFAGLNYPHLERDMATTLARSDGKFGGTLLESGTLKGMLAGRAELMSEENAKHRPRGTLLTFRFPVAINRWHIKQMLFT